MGLAQRAGARMYGESPKCGRAPPNARVIWGVPPRNGNLRESAEIEGLLSRTPNSGLVRFGPLSSVPFGFRETGRLAQRCELFSAFGGAAGRQGGRAIFDYLIVCLSVFGGSSGAESDRRARREGGAGGMPPAFRGRRPTHGSSREVAGPVFNVRFTLGPTQRGRVRGRAYVWEIA